MTVGHLKIEMGVVNPKGCRSDFLTCEIKVSVDKRTCNSVYSLMNIGAVAEGRIEAKKAYGENSVTASHNSRRKRRELPSSNQTLV